jgi:hypothetical protein
MKNCTITSNSGLLSSRIKNKDMYSFMEFVSFKKWPLKLEYKVLSREVS